MTLSKGVALEVLVDEIEQELDRDDLFFGHSTTNAWDEAAWIALYATGQDMAQSEFDWAMVPSDEQRAQMQALLEQRIDSKKPFAYLINEAWFCGQRFHVDERAIVPRSYFGEWIPEQFSPWLDAAKIKRAVDLCTGSGCIAIALAYAFPEAQIDATELSNEALEVAKINVDQHGLPSRVSLHQGDLFGDLQGQYDLICSNPPYINTQRMQNLPAEYYHEPDMAFRGGDLGLDIVDRLLAEAADHLNPGGTLIVEVGTAALDLEAQYPDLPFTWLSTDDEAMALFLLTREQLIASQCVG